MPSNRILQLEDDESDALLIRRALERAGLEIEITLTSSAEEYESALAANGFDLVLSDNCIPGFGSLGALKAARAAHPEVPFICVSGVWEERAVDNLLTHGVTCCVLKSHPTQIISAVRQALYLQDAKRDARDLALRQAATSRLVTAVQDLSHARDFETIREIVRHAARELTGADGATLVLRDGDQCHYVDEDAIGPLWKGQKFPLTSCISGWVMLNGTHAAIEDIYADARIPADAYRPTFVKSLLMMPIRPDAPLGAIGNYWAASHKVTPRELELLQALASTTAVAMENVRSHQLLEHRVRERTLQLEATNRELENFAFSVAHDLRSPLHSISAYSEMLEDTTMPPSAEERRDYLARIRTQTARMGRLIDDFLRIAQLTRADLRPEPVDLIRLSKDIVTNLKETAPDRDITFVHPPTLSTLGDPRLLLIALENLLSNAWKYTGRRTDGARIELGVTSTDRDAQTFFVRDNGAGFDPRYMSKLFTPFQRLHSPKDFPGSGVGLATVQRIVHKHGGQIWAEAQPNAGATFYFTLATDSAI